MDFEDCVYNKLSDGKVLVGGYTLDSILTEHPIMNSNTNVNVTNIQNGGSFSSMFKDLAVPAGLLYLQQNFNPQSKILSNIVKQGEVINDSLYDNLVDLVSKNKRIKHNAKTRKERRKKMKYTRKSR